MKRKLKVLDLFSGIGGFSYGLEMTGGFETTAFCEIDEFCQKVLKKHWPAPIKFRDIRNINFTKEGSFDVICGGFPCQDISVAGKQKGIKNETRSGLWNEYKRVIKEVKPRYVIIENVRNLLNNGLAIVLKDLHEIGYNAEWEVISARSVGACHLRERLWIVAWNTKGIRTQGLWSSGKQESRSLVKEGIPHSSSHEFTNSDSTRRLRKNSSQSKEWENNIESTRDNRESSRSFPIPPSAITNSNNFRFWPSFTTEEEKLKWWTEATASFSDWWEIESSICRVDDGLSNGLDKDRSNRIKALGNSIVPQIVKIIGDRILHHENER